jgi:predicted acetyltransferase
VRDEGVTEIRPVTSVEELRDATNAIVHYFGRERPTEEWAERWLKNFELERMHAAFEDGRIVGGAGAFGLQLTVPGGRTVATAGATIVGVLPSHRRRGILRAMMREQLDDVHERGEPLAALWASEETIYGRYGYGLAALSLTMDVPRARSEFRAGVHLEGRPRLVAAEEALQLIPPIYDAVQKVTPGLFVRPSSWWEHRRIADPAEFRFGAGPKNFVVIEVDGRAEAYAIYRLNPAWGDIGPETKVEVMEAIGLNPPATAAIWRFILDVDWMETIKTGFLPVDHPLLLLLERPRLARARMSDSLWVRLVDVGAALSGRGYAGDGSIVFEVHDGFCPWNEGRWKLEAGEASRTDDEADLALDVADLASVYLGGFTFRELLLAGRVEELRNGAVAQADGLFRSDVAPWCPEIF